MDRLASMAAFTKAAEVGSFAAAAAALGISPQMVAKHVAYLEARIGTRLLNRTTRRQNLTEIGKTYYDRCRLVLAEADWADSLADEARGAPRGRLRINAPVTFGTHALIPLVTRYLRRYPAVEIDLVLSDHFVDLIEEGFEAAFRIGPLVDSGLTARELAPFRLVACASPAYLRDRGTPSATLDLEDHECLGYANRAGPTVNDWQFIRDGRTHAVETCNHLRVNNAARLPNPVTPDAPAVPPGPAANAQAEELHRRRRWAVRPIRPEGVARISAISAQIIEPGLSTANSKD